MVNNSVLVAGESQQSIHIHIKGNDSFIDTDYFEAGNDLIEALESNDFGVTYQPCHIASENFPDTPEDLASFDVIILSDIGSKTLEVPPSTVWECNTKPERLPLLADYVKAGGGFLMVGGYMSFQGINGKAGYRNTPIERLLPVSLEPFDDRVERSGGVTPEIVSQDHPIVEGLNEEWPHFLGYNRVTPDAQSEVVAKVDEDPLLVVGEYGDGRAVAFTTDCAPHWAPPAFTEWEGYNDLWTNIVLWLAGAAEMD